MWDVDYFHNPHKYERNDKRGCCNRWLNLIKFKCLIYTLLYFLFKKTFTLFHSSSVFPTLHSFLFMLNFFFYWLCQYQERRWRWWHCSMYLYGDDNKVQCIVFFRRWMIKISWQYARENKKKVYDLEKIQFGSWNSLLDHFGY